MYNEDCVMSNALSTFYPPLKSLSTINVRVLRLFYLVNTDELQCSVGMTFIIFHIMLYLSSPILLYLDFVDTEKVKFDLEFACVPRTI
jgi:hypothetical protein